MANLVTNIGGNASGLISACEKSKNSLKKLQNEQKEMKGALGQLTSSFGISIGKLTAWGAAIGAAKAALNVMKDAVFSSEANIDAWGRTVDSAKSLYQGFLNSLNNGDIGGFLSNISSIVSAAQEAYNALDKLSTFKTISAPEKAGIKTEIDRVRMMIRTGRYISTPGGKNPFNLKDGQVMTAEQKQAYAKRLNYMTGQYKKTLTKQINFTDDAVEALYKKLGKENGLSKQEFKYLVSNWDNYDKVMENVRNYDTWNKENIPKWLYAMDSNNRDAWIMANNPYYSKKTMKYKNFADDSDAVKELQQYRLESIAARGELAQTQGQVNMALNRVNKQTGGSSKGGSGSNKTTEVEETTEETVVKLEDLNIELAESIDALDELSSAIRKIYGSTTSQGERNLATELLKAVDERRKKFTGETDTQPASKPISLDELYVGDATSIEELDDIISKANTIFNTSSSGYERYKATGIIDAANKKKNLLGGDPLNGLKEYRKNLMTKISQGDTGINIGAIMEELKEVDSLINSVNTNNPVVEAGNAAATAWGHVGEVLGQVGQAFSQIEAPELQAGAIIAQALASVALSFAQALSKENKLGVWGWIAAGLAGIGTLFTISNAIKSASAYAEGGIVDGNSYTGDKLWARVNSGEMILNRRQQANALRMIDANSNSSSMMPATITLRARGKDLVGVLSTTNKISSKI